MNANELYEQLKDSIVNLYRQSGQKAIYYYGSNLHDSLNNLEKFNNREAVDAIAGAFAGVAYKDGSLSREEYESFCIMTGIDIDSERLTYDDFVAIMSKYNKETYRNYTIDFFRRIRNEDVANIFISFCIAVSITDGEIHPDEEDFCKYLCDIFLSKFRQ